MNKSDNKRILHLNHKITIAVIEEKHIIYIPQEELNQSKTQLIEITNFLTDLFEKSDKKEKVDAEKID